MFTFTITGNTKKPLGWVLASFRTKQSLSRISTSPHAPQCYRMMHFYSSHKESFALIYDKRGKVAPSLSPAANTFCLCNTRDPSPPETERSHPDWRYACCRKSQADVSLWNPAAALMLFTPWDRFSVATLKHISQHSSLTDAPIFFVNSENTSKFQVLISQKPLLFKQNTSALAKGWAPAFSFFPRMSSLRLKQVRQSS